MLSGSDMLVDVFAESGLNQVMDESLKTIEFE